MTNKLVLIANSLKVPKIKKILLYDMKFLVPSYSCLQNPWIGGYRPPDHRSLCPLSSTEFVEPTPPEKNSWVRHCTHPYPNVLTAITFNDESSGLADRVHKGLEENAREGRRAEASNAAIATTHVTLHIAVVCHLKWHDKGLLPPERCPSVCQRRGPQPRRETR